METGTDSRRRGRTCSIAVSMLTAVVVAMLPVSPARATIVTFEPELFVGTFYTNNVRYLTGAGNVAYLTSFQGVTEDLSAAVAADLPLKTSWRHSSLIVRYRPALIRYDKAQELNNVDQLLSTTYTVATGRRFSFFLTGSASRTQLQGRPVDPATNKPADDFFLAPRTDRDALRGDVSAVYQWSPRWSTDVSASAFTEKYTAIPGVTSETGNSFLENRTGRGAGLRLARSTGTENSWSFGYRFDRYDLDVSGGEDVHRAGVDTRRRLTSRSALRGSLGGYLIRGDQPATSGPAAREDNGLYATVAWDTTVGREHLSVDVAVAPTSGGALRGTSIDFSAGATIAGVGTSPRWLWSASGRIGRRDPALVNDPVLDTFSVNGDVEWRPGESMGVRFLGSYVAQQNRETNENVGRYVTAGMALAWYPLGAPHGRGAARE